MPGTLAIKTAVAGIRPETVVDTLDLHLNRERVILPVSKVGCSLPNI